jgi:hypothetical protein
MEPAAYSTFQRRHEIGRKRQVTKYQVPKIIQEMKLIVHRGWHAGPILQQRFQRFKCGLRSKEKESSQKLGGKKTPKKESWLYIEDDMRVPWVSSLLNVSKAAGDQKKKEIAKNQRWKKNQEKKFYST